MAELLIKRFSTWREQHEARLNEVAEKIDSDHPSIAESQRNQLKLFATMFLRQYFQDGRSNQALTYAGFNHFEGMAGPLFSIIAGDEGSRQIMAFLKEEYRSHHTYGVKSREEGESESQ